MKNEINNYVEYLFVLALHKCGNLHDAEDLTQDTLLAAYQYLYRSGEIANMKYWLTSTLSHKWNDKLRKKYRLTTISFHDEPWSLVVNDKMKQNILIAAYEKPVTVVEISKALGIPTAYVESAVNDLLKSELMTSVGNRVFTDFMITTPEQRLCGLDVEIDLVERNYDALLKFINEYLDELGALPLVNSLSECTQKKLKYYFILRLFSHAIYVATGRIVPSKEEYPVRPDGGRV